MRDPRRAEHAAAARSLRRAARGGDGGDARCGAASARTRRRGTPRLRQRLLCPLLAEAPLTERHRRRADLCQPFREDAELAAAVRVASWEQPTAADRAADAQRTGVARAPNLVVPYPSALVGAASAAAGGGGGRRPSDLELRRPIRVLAAFGTLAADAALDDDAPRSSPSSAAHAHLTR